MSKGLILVVEDDADISRLLRIYFSGQGYQVAVAQRGQDALAQAYRHVPGVIVLDIELPDISGYEVCRRLRTNNLTRYVPIIFLTHKGERSDLIKGLELGADDYITKPFDMEELKLRIQNSMALIQGMKGVEPVSGLPGSSMVTDHLRQLQAQSGDWTYIDLHLAWFREFSEVYGWSAADEVVRMVAKMMREVVEQDGDAHDFMGHPARDTFVIISSVSDIDRMTGTLVRRFAVESQQHYSFMDRDRGHMLLTDSEDTREIPLMTMVVGSVSTRTQDFTDVQDIIEQAIQDRRRNARM